VPFCDDCGMEPRHTGAPPTARLRALDRVLELFLVRPVRRVRGLQQLVRFVAQRAPVHLGVKHARRGHYLQLRDVFIANGNHSPFGHDVRRGLVERFERVDREMRVATSPTDALFLAEAVLSIDCEGVLVECGCFQGGSTAKLSLLARTTGRRLLVFDSFAGLPPAMAGEIEDVNLREARDVRWGGGSYRGSLEVVQANVRRLGDISACRFVPGWFSDTLKDEHIPDPVALAFTDVDIAGSVRDCLAGLWPRLAHGGVFFSHDVAFVKVLRVFVDPALWGPVLGQPSPILFGAGFGLSDDSPMLGFCVKGREDDADYLRRLSLNKGQPSDGVPAP